MANRAKQKGEPPLSKQVQPHTCPAGGEAKFSVSFWGNRKLQGQIVRTGGEGQKKTFLGGVGQKDLHRACSPNLQNTL